MFNPKEYTVTAANPAETGPRIGVHDAAGEETVAVGGQKTWLPSNFRQQDPDDDDDGPSTLLDFSGSPDGDGVIAVADLDLDGMPDAADMDIDTDADGIDPENLMVSS